MKIFGVLVLLIHALAASRLVSGASIDRHESEKPAHTAVVNLFAPLDESTVAGDTGEVQDGGVDEYYYDDEEDEVSLSGDYGIEQPRVAFSSKPRDPSAVQGPEPSEGTERRGKGRKRGKGKGKGKKRNPCLRKYKDFCIHGTCQYLRDIRMPSCISCQAKTALLAQVTFLCNAAVIWKMPAGLFGRAMPPVQPSDVEERGQLQPHDRAGGGGGRPLLSLPHGHRHSAGDQVSQARGVRCGERGKGQIGVSASALSSWKRMPRKRKFYLRNKRRRKLGRTGTAGQ